jgi:hypothetical protein
LERFEAVPQTMPRRKTGGCGRNSHTGELRARPTLITTRRRGSSATAAIGTPPSGGRLPPFATSFSRPLYRGVIEWDRLRRNSERRQVKQHANDQPLRIDAPHLRWCLRNWLRPWRDVAGIGGSAIHERLMAGCAADRQLEVSNTSSRDFCGAPVRADGGRRARF